MIRVHFQPSIIFLVCSLNMYINTIIIPSVKGAIEKAQISILHFIPSSLKILITCESYSLSLNLAIAILILNFTILSLYYSAFKVRAIIMIQ